MNGSGLSEIATGLLLDATDQIPKSKSQNPNPRGRSKVATGLLMNATCISEIATAIL